MQIALGADLLVLALVIISCTAGLIGFRIVGAYHAAAWVSFVFVLGNGIVALTAKTILLQPLDSNLYAPLESFLALAAGSIVLLITLILSLIIPVGKPIFRSVDDRRFLNSLSTWTFVLGALFWYLNRVFQDPNGSGFGGVGVFWNLVLMAVVARTAMLLERSDGRRSIDASLVLILTGCIVMGLIDNQKTAVALPVVAYFATSLFFRGGITRWQAALGALGLVLMVTVVGPLIHVYRAVGIKGLPWTQRVSLIERGVKDALVQGNLERYERLASSEFLSVYYNYFGEGRGQMLLGRYASIQQIDPVIATVNRNGTVGGAVIWPAFTRLVPSVIYPDKPRYPEAYVAVVHLGLSDPKGNKYPNVPLLAQSYAGYGTVGLLVIPFFTFLALFLALKKLGSRLYRNVFGIFFFCVFTVVYANQAELGQYAEAVSRNFPLLAGTLWLIGRMHRVRGSPRTKVG